MNNRPLVSIIMPVYNIETCLPSALESVIAQTYTNIEVILVDDGSSDSSASICRQYSQKYAGIRYVRQERGGVSAARNRGIRETAGEYLIFLDSDDLFEPEMIEACVRAITSQDAALVIFGMFFDTLKNGRLKRRTIRSHEAGILTRDNLKDLYMDLFRANYFTPTWNKLYRRSLIVDNDVSFDEKLSNYEDLLFSLHCLAFVDKAVILPDPYYHYCHREREGASRIYREDIADKMIYLVTALRQQYRNLNLLDGLPELTADAQWFYVLGLCNICRSGTGIKEQAKAVSEYASNAVFSSYGIFDREYGSRFMRLCRFLTLDKRWTLLVMACRTRNFIKRIYR
jgi:glycosyltransferase involved in cell wall biosynthesis